MNVLGSFFLGDAHHMRLQSSSASPPISPTQSLILPRDGHQRQLSGGSTAVISPELSLELRIRWLEALVHGVKDDGKNVDTSLNEDDNAQTKDRKTRREKMNPEGIGERGETIARKLEEVQERLHSLVEENETLKLFLRHCKSFPRLRLSVHHWHYNRR
jgi:hypothetical protein